MPMKLAYRSATVRRFGTSASICTFVPSGKCTPSGSLIVSFFTVAVMLMPAP